MIHLEYDRQHLTDVIDAVVRKTLDMDLTWDWPCGVAYYGVCEAARATGRTEYLDMLKQWVDEYIELGLPIWTVNTCAMGHCLIDLYEYTGDEKYWNIVLEKIDYLQHDALRFADNVLQHTVSAKNDFPEQAWADTLFMAAFLMLRVGVKLQDAELIDDALNQYYWHIQYLQDRKSGLWYHGYSNIQKDHMSGFFWGRANAWAAYTMSQVNRRLPRPYLYPKFMEINCSLRDQLAGLKKLQTEDGLWRTILDDAESYEEVSAGCGIAAGMLQNGNILHSRYIQKALDGVLNNIGEDGSVLKVSGGTAVMSDREGYRQVPNSWGQGWGQGLALALLTLVLEKTENK